jgi:hypothetical protein
MSAATNNEKADHIYNLKVHAEEVFKKHGRMTNSAAYLACLCGMWAHTFGLPNKSLFEGNHELSSWFFCGHSASWTARSAAEKAEEERKAKAKK